MAQSLYKYRLKKTTTFEKIFAWYVDKGNTIILSDKEEEQRKRWEAAFSLLCNFHSIEDARPVLEKQFNISSAQAYRDIKNAINLFGDVTKSEKEGYRHIIFQYSMKVFQMASRDRNIMEMNKAISNMIKIKGLDREDPDFIDPSKVEPHEYRITVPTKVKKELQKLLEDGYVDLSEDIEEDD